MNDNKPSQPNNATQTNLHPIFRKINKNIKKSQISDLNINENKQKAHFHKTSFSNTNFSSTFYENESNYKHTSFLRMRKIKHDKTFFMKTSNRIRNELSVGVENKNKGISDSRKYILYKFPHMYKSFTNNNDLNIGNEGKGDYSKRIKIPRSKLKEILNYNHIQSNFGNIEDKNSEEYKKDNYLNDIGSSNIKDSNDKTKKDFTSNKCIFYKKKPKTKEEILIKSGTENRNLVYFSNKNIFNKRGKEESKKIISENSSLNIDDNHQSVFELSNLRKLKNCTSKERFFIDFHKKIQSKHIKHTFVFNQFEYDIDIHTKNRQKEKDFFSLLKLEKGKCVFDLLQYYQSKNLFIENYKRYINQKEYDEMNRLHVE